MNLELTESQQQWQGRAIKFAQTTLSGDVRQRDAEATFDRDAWRACGEFGLLGLPIPKSYGGLELGMAEILAIMEGLGYGASDQGLLYSVNAHLWATAMPILQHGTAEQKQKYLPALCKGDIIGASGISEAQAGSDVFAMQTQVAKNDDRYVLNGSKLYVTNGTIFDLMVVYGTLDPALGARGVTSFLIEKDTPGVSLGRIAQMMGLRTSPMAEVRFQGCEIAMSQRLGDEKRGASVFGSSMIWERGCLPALCLGVMRRQLEQAVDHARNRQQFGQPIGKFQSVANRIVDMKMRLETCRPLVYRLAALHEEQRNANQEAALAKLYVSDCYIKNSLDVIQVFGGEGYMVETGLERNLRDSIGFRLSSGTVDILRNIVARSLGL